jgi:hypothetical protein
MKASPLLLAGALTLAAGPGLAAPKPAPIADWTKKSPIRVVPGWIPDQEGTIVHMVPGARSGPNAPRPCEPPPAAAAPDCRCAPDAGVVKFRPLTSGNRRPPSLS